MSALPLRCLPPEDLPRERLLRDGPRVLSDAELVALLVGSGRVGGNAVDVASGLLAEWRGLAGLARATPAELVRTMGVGPATACRLSAAVEIASRLGTPRAGARLACSADIAAVAQPAIGRERTERLLVLVADGGQRLTRVEAVAVGQAGSCPVPVREVLALVLRYDGVTFAMAHNHPGGNPTPSAADISATDRLRDAAAGVGLRLLDHVVVSEQTWRSVTASR